MKKGQIVILFTVLISLFASCKKNCGAWYEGEDCKTEVREKRCGTYSGTRISVVNGDSTVETNVQTVIAKNSKGAQFLTDVGKNTYFELRNASKFVIGAGPDNPSDIMKGNGHFTGNTLVYTLFFSPSNSLSFEGSK